MTRSERVSNLVRELDGECWHLGFYEGIYLHQPGGHTLENRTKIEERKKIIEKIRSEISELLK